LILDGGSGYGAGGVQLNVSAVIVPRNETWKLAAGSMWKQRTRKALAACAGTETGAFGHPADRQTALSLLPTDVTC
jgi:hypothetical protein